MREADVAAATRRLLAPGPELKTRTRLMPRLTHFDAEGKAAMVDVSAKAETERSATAKGSVLMQPATLALIAAGDMKKGDVLAVARLAGIMAAKRTPDLIPLCHPLALTSIKVDLTIDKNAQRRRYRGDLQARRARPASRWRR